MNNKIAADQDLQLFCYNYILSGLLTKTYLIIENCCAAFVVPECRFNK